MIVSRITGPLSASGREHVGDQLAPGMSVAGQRPFGKQLLAGDRSRCLRPARGRAESGDRRPRRDVRREQILHHRSGDHRTRAEVLGDRVRRLRRVVDPAEHDHQTVTLDGAQRVEPERFRGRANRVDNRLARSRLEFRPARR